AFCADAGVAAKTHTHVTIENTCTPRLTICISSPRERRVDHARANEGPCKVLRFFVQSRLATIDARAERSRAHRTVRCARRARTTRTGTIDSLRNDGRGQLIRYS